MMLRKRAWDMMRDDFAAVREDASLAEAIRVMRESMKEHPENYVVVVKNKAGKLVGVVSIRSVLTAVKKSVLKEENLKQVGETDWDQAFRDACLICTQMRLDDYIERNIPVLRPNDPALVVLDNFLKDKNHWGVVVEGGKVIGVVYIADLYREMTRDMVKLF
ncbi:HPP family protein [Pseudodesulfovibrio senegalensis]|jgi:CBS domain-containing protein|uniref:CBS domain-containing protein n=1 Tax=Pseudodesulfovibrio senegalensis TaxID=1721087 RepID=A0A6N6N3K4_9BACT|nr:CBS domain-containing protein [Pseudodesulfovibrio senegalensis]KAB1442147.1 CBS domain-containing protein [Pseudodesulfovibrio senegalensis]